jgi:hypothetical protein
MWMSPSRHFLAYPVRAGRLVCYVDFVPTDEQMRESWSAPGDPDTLRREFAGWDPRIDELLGHVRTSHRWGMYDRQSLARWTRGWLTLLGDAAHPMLPHVGQGANQSIEDGMALATLLAAADRQSAPALLRHYEVLRRERIAAVQHGARGPVCATTPPPRISAAGTPRSLPTAPSAVGSTTTTSCQRPKRPPRPSVMHRVSPGRLPGAIPVRRPGCALRAVAHGHQACSARIAWQRVPARDSHRRAACPNRSSRRSGRGDGSRRAQQVIASNGRPPSGRWTRLITLISRTQGWRGTANRGDGVGLNHASAQWAGGRVTRALIGRRCGRQAAICVESARSVILVSRTHLNVTSADMLLIN